MFVCLRYYAPDNTIKIIASLTVSLLALFLDRRRPPKTKITCIPVNPPVPDNCPSRASGREGMAINESYDQPLRQLCDLGDLA